MNKVTFDGRIYRALNPVYMSDPLSGEGASLFGGRLNPMGLPALYTSLSPHTALKEANQVGDMQPTTLVAFNLKATSICDLRPAIVDHAYQSHPEEVNLLEKVKDPNWRYKLIKGDVPESHEAANQLLDDGFNGVIVPSFVRNANASDFNLVLWHWNHDEDNVMTVIDDQSRLKRDDP